MPVKRRAARRRRVDRVAELAAWAPVFGSGYDFFHELPPIGVATDEYDRPDRSAANDAWQRLGSAYMAEWAPRRHPDSAAPWALSTFGAPDAR